MDNISQAAELLQQQLSPFLAELSAYQQWLVHDATKVPLRARDGQKIDVTDPTNLCTLAEAERVIAANPTRSLGLGFALLPSDPFTVIDLDSYKTTDPVLLADHAQILREFDSYAERSPNGGTHIWIKGNAETRKPTGLYVESYSSAHYFTVTDSPINNVAIQPRQEKLNELILSIDSRVGAPCVPTVVLDGEQRASDAEIGERASTAANGDLFKALWKGDFMGNYNSQSEADFALINLLGFYSGNAAQIERMFKASPLGERDKAHRPIRYDNNGNRKDYVGKMVAKSFDKQIPQGDYSEAITKLKTEIAEKLKVESGIPLPPVERLASAWPAPMGPAAFHGLTGDFIRLVAESTEADINALVVTFLTAFGCWFGRNPFHTVEDTRHGTNLFSVIVGESSAARKGTGTDRVMKVLKQVDLSFFKERLHSGLSTGEGLINAIRDEREETEAVKNGAIFTTQTKVVDFGVKDKRLLALESEFAGILEHGKREGNVLSAIMRNAWDGNALRILAKTNKDSCQEPHVSLIGNITLDELKRCLAQKDISNGFSNRIFWCCARKSKFLPISKPVDKSTLENLVTRLTVTRVAQPTEIYWEKDSLALWYKEYVRLSSGNGNGLFAAITARAEAKVLRLALVYATLDNSETIKLPHLEAALEVWRYCEDSARYMFGDATSENLTNAILDKLAGAPQGLSKTEISNAFNRNKSSAQIESAIQQLHRAGKIEELFSNSNGRSTTIIRLRGGLNS